MLALALTRATTTQAIAHGASLSAAIFYALVLAPYLGIGVLIGIGQATGVPWRTVGAVIIAGAPILLLLVISVANAWFFVAGVERSQTLCRRMLWMNAAGAVLLGGVGSLLQVGFGPWMLVVAPIVIGQLGGSSLAAWRVLRVHEPRPGFCWNCEYEMGDLPVCPECGMKPELDAFS